MTDCILYSPQIQPLLGDWRWSPVVTMPVVSPSPGCCHGNERGLYNPAYESDACGVGFVVNIDGTESHRVSCQCLFVSFRDLCFAFASVCVCITNHIMGLSRHQPEKQASRKTTFKVHFGKFSFTLPNWRTAKYLCIGACGHVGLKRKGGERGYTFSLRLSHTHTRTHTHTLTICPPLLPPCPHGC